MDCSYFFLVVFIFITHCFAVAATFGVNNTKGLGERKKYVMPATKFQAFILTYLFGVIFAVVDRNALDFGNLFGFTAYATCSLSLFGILILRVIRELTGTPGLTIRFLEWVYDPA